MRINNKLKQFFAGNWCFDKKKIREQDFKKVEEPKLILKNRQSAKYRVKKEKKEYVYEGNLCPFCKKELPIVDKNKAKWWRWFANRQTWCDCGSKKVEECPACKNPTWYKDGIYKHQTHGCGFVGRKKVINND